MATKTMDKSLSDILARKGGKYLSDQEKQDLSDKGTQFTITSVTQTTGTYEGQKRQRWECGITLDDKARVLTVPTHDNRDETMDALAAYVKKNKKAGPVVLRVREMENGHSWLSIETPREKKGK